MRNSIYIDCPPVKGEVIHTADAIIIRDPEIRKALNHSCQLIEDLMRHFNLSPHAAERTDSEIQNLLHDLAFACICYHALFIELKGTPTAEWIKQNLSDIYQHNAGLPLAQLLEKVAKLQGEKE
ncbi:hypothetical protein [Necropsobacter rosorum]|uniref:hypothetical protein n=1 Tax=Necropsobacter rosorum TaxID=908285 RepID=UPI00068F4424